MRAAVLASLIPTAFAYWNADLCSNAGGCITWGSTEMNHPWRCPDGSALTLPEYDDDTIKAGGAGTQVASPEEFPKECYAGKYPSAGERLVKYPSSNNQTMYLWISSNCNDAKPEQPGDCYDANPNPSTINFCAMYDPSGGQCVTNPKAGLCERWGYSAIRPQCKYWKQGLQDLVDEEYGTSG